MKSFEQVPPASQRPSREDNYTQTDILTEWKSMKMFRLPAQRDRIYSLVIY